MFKRLLFVIMFLYYSLIYGYKLPIKFEHITTKDGLSHSWVRAICQDHQGFMWVGTNDGLNKYDGYNFIIYKYSHKSKNSLSDNSIVSIYEDNNGNLWIGTENGLNLYDRNNDRFIHKKNHWPQERINSILELENGNFYIGSSTGLYLYDPKNDSVTSDLVNEETFRELRDNNVHAILKDNNDNVWIGTLTGLYLLDTPKRQLIHFRKENERNIMSGNDIRTLLMDSKGRIWIGTDRGLDLLTYEKGYPEKAKIINYQHNPENQSSITNGRVLALMEDKLGNLWIGTENGSLDILDLNNLEENNIVFHHYKYDENDNSSLSYNSVYSIFEDRTGSIWVGTFGDGINLYNKSREKFIHYKQEKNNSNSLNNNFVNALLDEEDYLWIGTDGGLNLFDKKNKTFKHFVHDLNNSKSLGENGVWAIKRDSRGNLWVGTWAGGLNLFNSKTNTFTRFKNDPDDDNSIGSNNIFGIIEDRDKNLWTATMGGGLNLFDYKKRTFRKYLNTETNNLSINNDWIRTAFENSYGEIWLSVGRTIDLFDRKKEIFIHFKHDSSDHKSISYDGAITFFEDSKRNLWIGTTGGLNVYNREDSTFSYYQQEDGLPNNQINGILEDNHGNLWISTNKGISKLVNGINRPKEPTFKNYEINDGLQGNQFRPRSCCKGKDGKMYFGGTNGFNVFYPDSIKDNPYRPPVIITKFSLFNKNVPIGTEDSPLKKNISVTKEIILSYKHSVITFGFTALNFIAPKKNKYAYMLEGFEEEWNYVGDKREATYTNLDPGTYTFRVKGSNNDGIWNEEGTSLKIIITPPFWKTIWFRLSTILLIITAAYTIHKIRVRSIVAYGRRFKELANALENSNEELKQFAYIIAHDLKVPLRGVNQLAEWISDDYSGVLDKKGKKDLKLLKERTKFLNDIIQALLDYSKIGKTKSKTEHIDFNNLLEEAIYSISPPENAKIAIENKLPEYAGDSTLLSKIFENLISNAIKYSNKSEVVIKINCTDENNEWKFSIFDNGPGIEEKYFDKIFRIFETLDHKKTYKSTGIGLTIAKKIVEMEGGKIWVESKMGLGTTFYFTLPKQQKGNRVK